MTNNPRPPIGARHQRVGWETPAGLDETMIRMVVDRFYADARRDPLIDPVFNRIIAPKAWPHHLSVIADFLELHAARHRPLCRPPNAQAYGHPRAL